MIWIIGGTSEANEIAADLSSKDFDIVVSTTSEYGELLAQKNRVHVVCGKMDKPTMIQAFTNTSIVIDASHPYAQEVSENAMEACAHLKISYIRFERKTTTISGANYYPDYVALENSLKTVAGNIFLTIGSNNLHRLSALDRNRLIVRVLAVTESIMKCAEANIPAHNIIASKGRFTKETNMALMKEYNIKHLVTKDSGEAGGLFEKIAAAQELGIAVHIVEKSKIEYPLVFTDKNKLIQRVEQHMHNQN